MDTVAAVFNTFIPECKDLETLRGFWGINKGAIETLKKGDNKLYEEVLITSRAMPRNLNLKKGEAA